MKNHALIILLFALVSALFLGLGGSARAAVPSPDLSIMWEDQAGYVSVGKNIVYTVSIANLGNAPAANVDLKATLPNALAYVSDTSGMAPMITKTSYTWSFGQLGAGESKTFEISFSTDSLMETFTQDQIGLIKASATVSTTTNELNKKNDSATAETLLIPPVPDQTSVI